MLNSWSELAWEKMVLFHLPLLLWCHNDSLCMAHRLVNTQPFFTLINYLCSARPLEGPGCHVHGRQVLRHLCHECWLPDYSWGIFWDKCPCFPCHWSLLLQVMPTQLRGQGTALVNVMSMMALMASPYIVYSVRLGLAWLTFNMFYRQFYQRRLLFL